MKFEYLREFAVAARSNEMQQAAMQLGISLSVLSKHIKSIELELGVPLFVRARHVVLSQYGRIVLPYVLELIALQDSYEKAFSAENPSEGSILRVGLSPVQFRENSGKLIESFMVANPAIKVETVEGLNSDMEQFVKDGRCDLAFLRSLPQLNRDPELIYYPFCSDTMVAVLPMNHPFSEFSSIKLSDIAKEHIILRSENSSIYRALCEAFEAEGVSPDITFAGSYAVFDLVRKGEGITLYLASPLDEDLSAHVRIIPVNPSLTSFVDIIFRRGETSPEISRFIQYSGSAITRSAPQI